MQLKKLVAMGLVVVLALCVTFGASADMKKGKVSGGQYSSPSGISFNVPKGFSLGSQENKKAGFFRIVLGGRADARGFGPAIVIDIDSDTQDLEEYTGRKLLKDLEAYPLANVDKYEDASVIGNKLYEDHGLMVRESLVVFRLNRFSQARVAFSYSFCFNTDSHFVRASYLCFGAQRTLTEDIPAFMKLYNSLIVP